jgi:hypothetical protein
MPDMDLRIEHAMKTQHTSLFRSRVMSLIIAVGIMLLAFLMWSKITENSNTIGQLQQYVKTACQPVNDNPTTKSNASKDTQSVCNKAQNNQLPGPAGPPGASGQAGANGKTGPSGSPGATGSAGPSGKVGPSGSKGATGLTGGQGPAGKDGTDGLAGPAGPSGPPGSTGPTGPAGQNGTDGTNGKDGRSIESTDCVDGRWVVTYSDGTSQTTNGVCIPG